MSNALSAFFLVGPTAVGKSGAAQLLAERMDAAILSADSMMVYRAMDIGTAKPLPHERGSVPYYGIDLVSPRQKFSVWDYRQHALQALSECAEKGNGAIVTGGTGLYIKSLTHGLDARRGADEKLREYWNERLRQEGVAPLQQHLRENAPELYAALDDRENPRRLIRALEESRRGRSGGSWADLGKGPLIIGLSMENGLLHERIAKRVDIMYKSGMVEEAERLLTSGDPLSETAAQAIGYAEAIAYIEGKISVEQAKERTVIRTRQLAKRQRTWFRHQANVEWVEVTADMSVEDVAARVESLWRDHGRTPIRTED